MKRFISTALAVFLLLGLALLAVLARPNGGLQDASARADSPVGQTESAQVTSPEVAPSSPSAVVNKYNMIALPLDTTGVITPFKASGLAAYQPGTKQVLQWSASNQKYDSYTPGVSPPPLNFNLSLAGSYLLLLDSTSGYTFTIVGGVPVSGTVHFTLTVGTASICKYNAISVPLQRSDITNASQLAAAIGGVKQVLKWNAGNQKYDSYTPGVSPPPLNFAVSIGYPYLVCLNNLAPTLWP